MFAEVSIKRLIRRLNKKHQQNIGKRSLIKIFVEVLIRRLNKKHQQNIGRKSLIKMFAEEV